MEVAGTSYGTKNIVIATGSESIPLKGIEVDETRIVTSTGALELAEVPKHLRVVIGGGVIGWSWQRLSSPGAEVTVIEYLDRITPGMDTELGKAFERVLVKQGFQVPPQDQGHGGAKVDATGVDLTSNPPPGAWRRRAARRCGAAGHRPPPAVEWAGPYRGRRRAG